MNYELKKGGAASNHDVAPPQLIKLHLSNNHEYKISVIQLKNVRFCKFLLFVISINSTIYQFILSFQ